VAESLAAGTLLILPIGAAAKAHGPYLPLGTKRFFVEALADRLAARLPVLIAPTIGIGYFPAFVECPASQRISADLFKRSSKMSWGVSLKAVRKICCC
jgi:creatinine amidohydrolase